MFKRLYEIGCNVSGRAADIAGHPAAILLVAVFCAVWFLIGGPASENALTLVLSVASITLTQMVLNGQRRSEQALHLKMDELVYALEGARNAVAGVESRSTDELNALRRTAEEVEEALGGKEPA